MQRLANGLCRRDTIVVSAVAGSFLVELRGGIATLGLAWRSARRRFAFLLGGAAVIGLVPVMPSSWFSNASTYLIAYWAKTSQSTGSD